MDPLDGPRCPHCASTDLEAVAVRSAFRTGRRGRPPNRSQWFNRCRDCGKLSDYVPTPGVLADARREPPSPVAAVNASRGERRVDAALVRRVREAADGGMTSRDIASAVGYNTSTIGKIRTGRYDHLLDADEPLPGTAPLSARVYCPGCRNWIAQLPCVLCTTLLWRAERPPPRPSIAPAGVRPGLRERLELPLASLPWAGEDQATRMVNLLEGADYWTVGQVLAATPAELLEIDGFGPKCVRFLREALARLGFCNTPPAASEAA